MSQDHFPTLTVQRSCDKTETLVLDSSHVTIGSAPDCTVSDTQTLLAPRHAELLASGREWLLRDCGTPDGTFVNGSFLEGTHQLRHNDVIQLGEMILIFHAPAAGNSGKLPEAARFNGGTFKEIACRLEENISKVFKGKPEVVRNLLICLLADGHLLLEDAPGWAKAFLPRLWQSQFFPVTAVSSLPLT